MRHNYTFSSINDALPSLSAALMRDGEEVGSRLGERVKEQTAVGITLTEPWKRATQLPSRKANIAAQIAETMWVLGGRNDVEWLERYLPRAKDFSDDGKTWAGGYGPRLRAWTGNGRTIDQVENVIEILRKDPTSRRAFMAIYDPGRDTREGLKDTPCNTSIQFLSRLGNLEMIVNVRSNDLIWGWSGINTFEWSALQEIIADRLGIRVGSLHFNIGSLHIYDRHWKRAAELRGEHLQNAFETKYIRFHNPDQHSLSSLTKLWFAAEAEIREDPWSTTSRDRINQLPEPMMRAWLRVIQWWWSGNPDYLDLIRGTDLEAACFVGLQPPERGAGEVTPSEFVRYVDNLHREKDAAYGSSWCKRGEQIGILANIARKVDRLGAEGGGDTSTDTAIDLLVYVVKYSDWLNFGTHQATGQEHCDRVESRINNLRRTIGKVFTHPYEDELRQKFAELEEIVREDPKGCNFYDDRGDVAENMAVIAFGYAFEKWGRS